MYLYSIIKKYKIFLPIKILRIKKYLKKKFLIFYFSTILLFYHFAGMNQLSKKFSFLKIFHFFLSKYKKKINN